MSWRSVIRFVVVDDAISDGLMELIVHLFLSFVSLSLQRTSELVGTGVCGVGEMFCC